MIEQIQDLCVIVRGLRERVKRLEQEVFKTLPKVHNIPDSTVYQSTVYQGYCGLYPWLNSLSIPDSTVYQVLPARTVWASDFVGFPETHVLESPKFCDWERYKFEFIRYGCTDISWEISWIILNYLHQQKLPFEWQFLDFKWQFLDMKQTKLNWPSLHCSFWLAGNSWTGCPRVAGLSNLFDYAGWVHISKSQKRERPRALLVVTTW
jgi:hypothetical protein